MAQPPPINPDVNNVADRAKHGYAVGTRLLAAVQYRLAMLAGSGRLDPKESMRLQSVLADVWSALYSGTTCAVRDWDTEEDTWEEADNTYSDGRTVMVQTLIEGWDESVVARERKGFLLAEGAVLEHRRGTTCHISPRTPTEDRGADNASQTDVPGEFSAYRETLRPATDWAERALAKAERLEDENDNA